MDRLRHWTLDYSYNPVKIGLSDPDYVHSKKHDSNEEMKVRAIYELFLGNLCFFIASTDGFCDPEEEIEYVKKCNFAQKSLYAEFGFVFKEKTKNGYQALVSEKIFEEKCDRVTLDHSISQKMKLDELARRIFNSNIGYREFKESLFEARKVALLKKEENLGKLSSIQKNLAKQNIWGKKAIQIYDLASVKVINVYCHDSVSGFFREAKNNGTDVSILKENFIWNFSRKNKNSNFSKIPLSIKEEIINIIKKY